VSKKIKKDRVLFKKYSFKSELWKYDGPGGWCFVTLPSEVSQKVRNNHFSAEEGWGRLKAQAQVGNTYWETSIWFDLKRSSYLLPIKAIIRKKEKLVIGKAVSLKLVIKVDQWPITKLTKDPNNHSVD
jgi:hypothetical protein